MKFKRNKKEEKEEYGVSRLVVRSRVSQIGEQKMMMRDLTFLRKRKANELVSTTLEIPGELSVHCLPIGQKKGKAKRLNLRPLTHCMKHCNITSLFYACIL